MIKILLVSRTYRHPYRGGVVNYVELLNNYLDKNDYSVEHFVQGLELNHHFSFLLPFIYLYQLIKFKKTLSIYDPDVIHLNSSLTWVAIIRDFLLLKIAKSRNLPVLFFIHGWQTDISKSFESVLFKRYFKIRFKMADAIVVLANQFKEKLSDLGINPDKIYVTSTMIESEKYLPEDKNFSRPYNILFCAAIKKEKGPFEILESAPIVLSQFPNTKFIFMGSGKDLGKLKEKAKQMLLKKNVEFTGYVTLEEKIRRYKESHIFVLPTFHGEGFPTVVLEAMAAGLPVITTPNAGLVGAIENGREGFLLKTMPSEPKEIAEKIIILIENPELMKKISKNNIKRAKEEFDVKVVSKQIAVMYHKIQRRE